MFKIPNENKRFIQTNQSDLFGNIHYTKSINFDEEGYLKLSSRCVSIINSETDVNFNIPVSFGRTSNGDFFLATTENPYILSLVDGNSTLLQDTDDGGDTHPSLNFVTYGKWFNKLWHVTNNTKLYYKTLLTGNWTDTGLALTTGLSHPIESFRKANTLMIGNGNTITQVSTAYSTSGLAQLTISADYEIVGLAYNNNNLGIATRLAQTVVGENLEAGFFIWDGSGSSANQVYGCGSDAIVDIAPYRSSYIILTRNGELLYFNGGGFDRLGAFPVYFKDVVWGDFISKLGYGDMLKVDGELIYINVDNQITDNNLNTYLENHLGGIWCYDPNVGLYHKYAPSISQGTVLAVEQAGVNTTTNTFTVYNANSLPTTPTIPPTGNPIKVVDSSVGGLNEGKIYFIIKVNATTFRLATTKQNALDTVAVDITSTGGNYSYFMAVDVKDYGLSRNIQNGGVDLMGDKAYVYNNIIFGGSYYDSNSTATYAHLNVSVAGFKNVGYFVTSKFNSSGIEDIIPKIFIKYRPLNSEDKIKVKYQNKDIIGIPETANCTATSDTVLTTTSYIPNSDAFTGELECEVISGAGAGQMVKVTSISESAGTYTITLSEALEGVSASDSLAIKLENWKEMLTITSDDTTNWKEIPLAEVSKWTKLKVVLEGSETTIEELQVINKGHIDSI